MNHLIESTLSSLDASVHFANYSGSDSTYVVYQEYNQAPSLHADDEEIRTKYFYQVDVFSSGNYSQTVKELKRLMNEAGFKRTFEAGEYVSELSKYRKLLRFSYEAAS
ncbi:hypothetical protein ACQCT3_17990 [Sutcliffiella horikoshii]|uniref:hypothetical protein n=1 Tax=Sutcliffiella horikoshii TaxID=79883 RepID=UPI003CEC3BC7